MCNVVYFDFGCRIKNGRIEKNKYLIYSYSLETTYGINSVISKLMTIVENAETG
jgi:hypothetical protein